MPYADVAKVALLVFAAALLQVTVVATLDVGGGAPDLLLVLLVALALLRGSIVGAGAGFFGGLLVDTTTLETLGLTSLLLTLVGYWVGRYGETTGRDRAHAPVLSVLVVTVLYAVGRYALQFILADAVSARLVLVDTLVPTLVFNLILTLPVYAFSRRLLAPRTTPERAREVRLLV